MGVKDAYQFDYLDDNQRFADQVNGALFGGRQVVRNMLSESIAYNKQWRQKKA
jgi:hypothetical protein